MRNFFFNRNRKAQIQKFSLDRKISVLVNYSLNQPKIDYQILTRIPLVKKKIKTIIQLILLFPPNLIFTISLNSVSCPNVTYKVLLDISKGDFFW